MTSVSLTELLLKEHSRAQCDIIVQWVGNSQQRFDELTELFLSDVPRLVQRAAWPLSYCVMNHPTLIKKHFSSFIKNLSKPGLHNAVKRNTLRWLQEVTIPERFHGEIMNNCFDYILSNTEPAAVKAFSLTVLHNLSGQYPDILPEIKLVIEERLPHERAAFRSRAKKILQDVRY